MTCLKNSCDTPVACHGTPAEDRCCPEGSQKRGTCLGWAGRETLSLGGGRLLGWLWRPNAQRERVRGRGGDNQRLLRVFRELLLVPYGQVGSHERWGWTVGRGQTPKGIVCQGEDSEDNGQPTKLVGGGVTPPVWIPAGSFGFSVKSRGDAGHRTGAGRPAGRVCQQCERDEVFGCLTQGGPVGRRGQTQAHSGDELVGEDCLDGTEAGATGGWGAARWEPCREVVLQRWVSL